MTDPKVLREAIALVLFDSGQDYRHNHATADALLSGPLAPLLAELDASKASIAWVREIYPEPLPWGGARVEMAWDEFNAMRVAAGLSPVKPYGKAGERSKLRAELDASKAEIERLRAAFSDEKAAMCAMIAMLKGRDTENERLREALHKIYMADSITFDEAEGTLVEVPMSEEEMSDIARSALSDSRSEGET